ncbi:short-chain dehydrogenase/reductase SDR [Streptomyces bingchenggensis BCW-1]|uniref:Short-chain dehydrogenase/reductase SDR n=1 Tax=Streptomyces bingchenggensis (strain BCW-1) TaxID=749414 RepID=D7BTR5_STRBB|nr:MULTISPECIES: SDR family NAD(P)-dependent oxidoreductase [Streptomyces]ADI09484.1 short-chain dehydrogenase/reductase SDR [Streptomyces bingchenggensis BCW-1]
MPGTTPAPDSRTAVVIGVGPGLGMSIAHRFGREGYAVALVSRSAARHAGYLSSLADAGIEASAHVADVRDREQILATLDTIAGQRGSIDVLYYGPGAIDGGARPGSITEADSDAVRRAMDEMVYPAVDIVGKVLPGMVERGAGGLLFAGGLSSVVPMPVLGSLALSSAALRNYALTLNAALSGQGIYAGTVTIGGLIERGDIHKMFTSQPGQFGGGDGDIDIDVASLEVKTLNPDELADAAWRLYADRDRPEVTFNVFG